MKVEVVTMTPEKAKELLGKNTHNRPANRVRVLRLSELMKEGKWKLNGDAIRVGNGRLIDGQHRLMACVQAEVPFETVLVTGLGNDVFDTIDTGKRRGGADTFAVLGEKNYSLLAASVGIVHLYYEGKATDKMAPKNATNQDFEKWLKEHASLRYSADFCVGKNTRLLPLSIVTAAHYIFSRIPDASAHADDFITRLTSQENIIPDSPMSKLIQKLIENYTSKRKFDRANLLNLVIRSWNAERTGRAIRRMYARTDAEAEQTVTDAV